MAIDASNEAFRNYDGSYIYGYSAFEPNQCTDVTNHGVLVVGYGTMKPKTYCKGQDCYPEAVEYFIFKNSYGEPWGSEGYGAMWTGEDGSTTGACGILTQAVVMNGWTTCAENGGTHCFKPVTN